MNNSELIAQKLLEIEAIFLKPREMFTWASGIKSPIYCDNRIALSYPELRDLIKSAFVQLIQAKFKGEINKIAGVATAGIAHATLVADALGLPMIYVRPEAKNHGRQNQIEGKLDPSDKILVIEDLISTAASSLKAVEAVQVEGAQVKALLAIFTYNLPQASTAIAAAQIPVHTLSNYNELINTALKTGYVDQGEYEILQNWHQQLVTTDSTC